MNYVDQHVFFVCIYIHTHILKKNTSDDLLPFLHQDCNDWLCQMASIPKRSRLYVDPEAGTPKIGGLVVCVSSNLVTWPADNLLAQWPVSRHDRDECVSVGLCFSFWAFGGIFRFQPLVLGGVIPMCIYRWWPPCPRLLAIDLVLAGYQMAMSGQVVWQRVSLLAHWKNWKNLTVIDVNFILLMVKPSSGINYSYWLVDKILEPSTATRSPNCPIAQTPALTSSGRSPTQELLSHMAPVGGCCWLERFWSKLRGWNAWN